MPGRVSSPVGGNWEIRRATKESPEGDGSRTSLEWPFPINGMRQGEKDGLALHPWEIIR